MTRFLKTAGIVAAIFAGLLIFAVVAVNLISGQQYKSMIRAVVKSATGRELAIDGDLDIKLFSTLAFKASGVKLANARWGSVPQMLSIDNIAGEVALLPLLRGILDVTLTVEKPDLLLETDNSGKANWRFAESAQAPAGVVSKAPKGKSARESTGGMPLHLRIRKLNLDGTHVVYLDGKSGKQVVLRSEKLHVGSTGNQLAVELKGQFNDIPLALSGGFDHADFLADNQSAHVKFKGRFGGLQLAVQGTAGPLAPTWDLDVSLVAKTDSLTAISPLAGRDLPDLGPLSVAAKLTGKKGKYTISDLVARLDDTILTAQATGAIADLAAMDGLDWTVKADTGDLTAIFKQIGYLPEYPLPDVLHAMVVLKGSLKDLAVKQFQAKIQNRGIHATVNGEAKNILLLKGVRADVSLQADSLDVLSPFVKTRLPALAPLTAHVHLISKDRNLGNMQIQANLKGQNVYADITGSVGDPLKLKDVHTDVTLGADSLAWLAEYTKMELPPLGSLKASASIASAGKSFEIKNIKVDLAGKKIQASIAGSIRDALKLAGVSANIHLAVDSLASLDPLVKRELPASGPVVLEGKISGKRNLTEPIDITAEMKSDGVRVNFAGNIANPLSAMGMDITLTAAADSLQKVGKLTGASIQGREALKLEGKFTSAQNTYELADLHLQVGELDVRGQAAFKPPAGPGSRPQVSGKLHVGKLNLSKQQRKAAPATEIKSSPADRKKKDEAKKDKIFSSRPLALGPLRAVDADLQVTVESLTTLRLQLNDVVTHVTLDNGRLHLKPMQAKVGKGVFDGNLTLDARNTPASLTADMEMTDATFLNFGGKLHFQADLDGNGDSIAAIMAGLNGRLVLDARGATLKKSFMTGFGSGLLNSLNPFAKGKDKTKLNCAIILFDIKDGIADAHRKIAVQMEDVTWLGSGEINLKTEEIDFGLSPTSRKGLGISLAGLANLVHIGGTLGKPRIELDPKDVAVKYGKYAAAMATGGLSLAAELFWGKIKANTDVCAKILEGLDAGDKKPHAN